MPKDESTLLEQASTADALRIVLRAEIEAKSALSACEEQAAKITEDALDRARRIRSLAEGRIQRIRSHHSDMATRRKRLLESKITELGTKSALNAAELKQLSGAVEKLVDEMLGADD